MVGERESAHYGNVAEWTHENVVVYRLHTVRLNVCEILLENKSTKENEAKQTNTRV